jgi:hypothetical protein
MNLVIKAGGEIICLYSESLDLSALGSLAIRRASHVEPDERGKWWADLVPLAGPRLGPFRVRSEALRAESEWIECHILN